MGLRRNVDILGDPRAAIRSMAVPVLISLAVVQRNVFADTFWVSNLGVSAVSGMTSAEPMYTAISVIGIGLSTGIVTTISYNIGKGNMEAAGKLAGNTIFLAVGVPIVCSAILFVSLDALIGIMGAEDVSTEIHDYMLPYLLFSPVTVLNTGFGGMLRAEGAAGRSTMVQMSSVGLNIVLDPLLIFGLDLGITGAALATVLSYLFGVCLSAGWYLRRKTRITVRRSDLRPERATILELLGVGGPRIVEGFVNNAVILIQRIFIIMASGTVGVSLFNVPFRYISLSMCPVEATGMAAVPVIAANQGKGDAGKMLIARATMYRTAMIISAIVALLMLLCAPLLIGLFTMEPSMNEWYDEFLWNMRAYCIILPLFAVQAASVSVLQAIRKTKLPMRMSIIVGIFRIFAFWTACPYGFKGITVALILSYVLSCTISLIMALRHFSEALPEPAAESS
ncbi:MAG: polysaccharide biosynthesis C-terminal domain-containing protein [Candidatus Methanomethylophilaceae archaeon]|nr:polysaccharide biosynthesis C-terminal domain-containing protein [Candidatus Methanomethylophilaceae archaeon]